MSARVAGVVSNWWGIMRQQKQLTWFTSGYAQVAAIFPVLVAAPRYFSGEIQFSGLFQISQAFMQVETALSWFVKAYAELAQWKATVDRLVDFERALTDTMEVAPLPSVCRQATTAKCLNIRDFSIWLPGGAPVLQKFTLGLEPGTRILVSGPSGCGKSTLFRAISGIWPYCSGTLSIPAGGRMLFLPQKNYLPSGPLRDAAVYPAQVDTDDDPHICEALKDCGLGSLVDMLDDRRNWAQQLSPGEQQRLAIVRALLLRPQWLFLDEATSALDEEFRTSPV